MKLKGQRVVVTRASRGETAHLLEVAGARVHHLPAIETGPPKDAAPLARAVAELSEYDDLVFTSATAVAAFAKAAAQLELPTFGRARILAVGPATAGAVEAAGGDLGKIGAGGGEVLASMYEPGELKGRRILFPRAEGGRESFPEAARAAGARVEVVAAYQTRRRPEAGAALAALLEEGAVHAVCFASPSAVEAVATGLCDLEAWARFAAVALGETTAAALRAVGAPRITVATKPTAAALARAVIELLGDI